MKSQRFDLEKAVIFRNNDYVVINKPPFLSTLEDRSTEDNLLSLIKLHEPDAQVCHRLDKDTSGALAIALNPEAYRHLSMQFEHREVSKIYHAVVDGIHSFNEKLVDLAIEKLSDGTVHLSRNGKSAQTYFTTLETFKNHTLLECRPITGRMHQIRIHLKSLGASITGDELYGGKPFFVSSVKRNFNLKKQSEEQPLIKRMALHAYSLEFTLLNQEKIKLMAPYPKDFQALVRQLSENKR